MSNSIKNKRETWCGYRPSVMSAKKKNKKNERKEGKQMNDFELMVDILKRGRANFDTFQWRGADCIRVYNDVDEVLEFTFDEFGNIIIIE